MVNAGFGPSQPRTSGGGPMRLALGVIAPLAVLALAYLLWWISDQLISVGPLDRAAFGWAVVIPIWCGAPVSAAFAWRSLDARSTKLAAAAFALIVSTIASVLFWASVAFPDCPSGPVRTPLGWILPSIVLGVTIGGGLALSGLLGRFVLRSGHGWGAVVLAAGSEFALIFVALIVFVAVSLGSGLGGGFVGPCGLPK